VVACAKQRTSTIKYAAESALLPAYFWFATSFPAIAEEAADFGKGGNADPKSYYTVLALFLLSVPGTHLA
jgi:hypothetical protein